MLQILTYANHIAFGMAYLHENKMVHRDLKSPNILIDSFNVAKVRFYVLVCMQMHCNLGLAKNAVFCVRLANQSILGHHPEDWLPRDDHTPDPSARSARSLQIYQRQSPQL